MAGEVPRLKSNEKCPIAIADLVLLYNRSMEGLYKKCGDVLTFDLFAGVPGIKAPFIKFCKAFEKRLRSSVPSHRVIPVNEEQPTNLDVAGFTTEWKRLLPAIRSRFAELQDTRGARNIIVSRRRYRMGNLAGSRR